MALCGSTTTCCVCVSLGQTAGMCQPGDEWSRPVDELHRRAHLHCGAHLPLGKFKPLHEVRVLPLGLLGFNEEEGCCRATAGWCFLWHPACSAEWISVKSSRLTLAYICLCYAAVQLFNPFIRIFELKHGFSWVWESMESVINQA